MAESRTPSDPSRATVLAETPTTTCGRLCLATVFLVVGLVAGAVAFAGIGRYGNAFKLPPEVDRLNYIDQITHEEAARLEAAEILRSYQNTALSVAILGGVAGGILGLAVGLRRRTFAATGGGLIGGVLLGATFGGLGGLVEMYLGYRLWSLNFGPLDFERTFKTMVTHSAAFLIAGVGIGLAAGFAARRVRHSLGVVLAAALIAGLVYPGLAAALFPVLHTDAVIPHEVGPLLLWTVMPVALMGLALGRTKAAPRPARA